MKRINWQVTLAILLILCSAVLYLIHYIIFRDLHHIFIYLLGDIAFVPIEVLLVTLVIHQMLAAREKRNLLKKMNMVIGTFFSEVGTALLKEISEFDEQVETIKKAVRFTGAWTDQSFKQAKKQIQDYDCRINLRKGNLESLRNFLKDKRSFLLGLLENQNLLEHESFTDLLWAVFHAMEELVLRKDISRLSPNDAEHVAGDIKRVYLLLMTEWMAYLEHLRKDYPYLFSLAIRTNPFDPTATPEID
jgi:hypothetical protein